jgi:hypothetical protein
MMPAMSLDAWLATVSGHYLAEYLEGGGSAVKFAVCVDDTPVAEVHERVLGAAREHGFLTAQLSADRVRVQHIERLFGAICDQVPWDDLTLRVLGRLAEAQGWSVPSPVHRERGLVDQLAEHNDLDRKQVDLVLQRQIGGRILQERALAKDFRVAMTWLAREQLREGTAQGSARQQITDWLGGRVRAIGNLRPYQIYTKVSRANARHLFGSLCAWIRKAGYPGLVVTLDGSRLLASTKTEDGLPGYSTAAVLDAYEVLRQFIDATDELDGLLLVVTMPTGFLELDARARGIGRYPALMGRVYDEVHDRHQANPFSGLVRIGGQRQAA